MQIPAWVKGRSYKAVLLSTLFAAAAYLLTVLWTGWSEVRQAIIAIGFSGLAIALVLSLLNYMLRFVRWQLYLQTLGYPIRDLAKLTDLSGRIRTNHHTGQSRRIVAKFVTATTFGAVAT